MLRRAASRFGTLTRRWIDIDTRIPKWSPEMVSDKRSFASKIDEEIKASEDMFSPTKFKVPPRHVFGIPGRYASACWSAAAKEKKLEKIEKELDDIKKVCDEKPYFLLELSDPTQIRHKRIANVRETFTKAGVDRIVQNLFIVMAENGRLRFTPRVIEDYKKLMSAHRKETVVTVTTAQELSKPDQKQLMLSLKKRIGEDRNITMNMEVEPEIVGGLIVEWDDAYRLDLSVASSIKRLEADLMNML